MGYDSNFSLRVVGDTITERKKVIDEIEKVSGYTFSGKNDDSADLEEAHWYDSDSDLLAVSKKHPDVIIELHRVGEDRDDEVISRYKNGEVEEISVQFIWGKFKHILLPDEEPEKPVTFAERITTIVLEAIKSINAYNGKKIVKRTKKTKWLDYDDSWLILGNGKPFFRHKKYKSERTLDDDEIIELADLLLEDQKEELRKNASTFSIKSEETNISVIEDWWRHQGCYDRSKSSCIPYDERDEPSAFLQSTDDWWDSLSVEQKKAVYEEFFSED